MGEAVRAHLHGDCSRRLSGAALEEHGRIALNTTPKSIEDGGASTLLFDGTHPELVQFFCDIDLVELRSTGFSVSIPSAAYLPALGAKHPSALRAPKQMSPLRTHYCS